jgi:hypothetical protein
MFNVRQFVSPIFRADIGYVWRISNGHVRDKCAVSDSSITRRASIRRFLEISHSNVTMIVPLRFDKFQRGRYSAIIIVASRNLNHSLSRLDSNVAIERCTKISHWKSFRLLRRVGWNLIDGNLSTATTLSTLATIGTHTLSVTERTSHELGNLRHKATSQWKSPIVTWGLSYVAGTRRVLPCHSMPRDAMPNPL